MARRKLGNLAGEWVETGPRDAAPWMRDAIWRMYAGSYGAKGLIIPNASAFDEFDLWEVYLDSAGDARSFVLSKRTPFGIKRGLSGTDGSQDAKTMYKQKSAEDLFVPGVYAEVSHKVEDIARKARAPVVCALDAGAILNKAIEIQPDGIHYARKITGLAEPVVKVMVGNPKGVVNQTNFDSPSCPSTRMNGLRLNRWDLRGLASLEFSPRMEAAIEIAAMEGY